MLLTCGICRIFALLSRIRFCCKYALFGICFVQTFTQTLRILLRFCADICPINWSLRPLLAINTSPPQLAHSTRPAHAQGAAPTNEPADDRFSKSLPNVQRHNQGLNFCIFRYPGSEPKKSKEPKKLEVKRGERGETEREWGRGKRGGQYFFFC